MLHNILKVTNVEVHYIKKKNSAKKTIYIIKNTIFLFFKELYKFKKKFNISLIIKEYLDFKIQWQF